MDKTITLTSQALLWAGSCGQQVGAYLHACGNIRLVNNANMAKHSASPLIFPSWGPQGKLYLLGRIYIFYPWGGRYFHFPESQSLPIFQSTSFSSKLTPWLGLSGTEGKWQDMSDKLRDEATTGIDKGAGERVSAVLLGDAGGWHWWLKRCWWGSERFVLFFCWITASVHYAKIYKKEEEKFLLPPPSVQISESQVFFTGTLEIEFATLHSNLK